MTVCVCTHMGEIYAFTCKCKCKCLHVHMRPHVCAQVCTVPLAIIKNTYCIELYLCKVSLSLTFQSTSVSPLSGIQLHIHSHVTMVTSYKLIILILFSFLKTQSSEFCHCSS